MLVCGCTIEPRHPALQGTALPELLPAREFFANRASSGRYLVSPDGRKVAWIAVKGVGPALFVKTIDRPDVISFGVMPIAFRWAQDSRRLFYLKDERGDENYHVMMVDTDRPDTLAVDLTPHPGVQATVQRVLRHDPEHILVVHNRRDKALFDLYRINLATREETLIAQNPGDATAVVTDDHGAVVAYVREGGERTRLFGRSPGRDALQEIVSWLPEETVRPVDVSHDGRSLYLLSNRNRDRVALTRLELADGRETIVYEDPEVAIHDAVTSRVTHEPLLAYSEPGYPKLHVFDAALRADLARLLPEPPRGVRVLSTDDRERRLTVKADTDSETRYWLFDRASGERSLLGEGPNTRRADVVAAMRPIAIRSRDGLALHGYLTLPKGLAPRALPTVLLVHGGPWWRDAWDNSLDVEQFLANRGYAVLQINYRGSTGYGRAFTEAAIGEFGRKMQDDLVDAVRWAIGEGISDPAKVAIMGASYGGYAALAGLAFTPEIFACGVSLVGGSNWATLVETAPKYWKPLAHKFHRYIGDPAIPEQRERMLAISPITHADAVRAPVLIIQTENDVRVKREQGDAMAEALRRAGKDVTYLLLPGEGHNVFAWSWAKRLKAFRKTEDFLARCLGGRSSGFDFYELGAWLF